MMPSGHRSLWLAALLAAPAAAQPAQVRLDKDRAIFAGIRDDFPVESERANPAEFAAYNAVLLHARQFPPAELEAAARRDVTFKDLFNPTRQLFKLELVYLDGRLARLRRVPPTPDLAAAGVTALYEAWVFPRGDGRFPVCVVVSELPPGLTPPADATADPGAWVGFAGYSFKLMRYESAGADWKRAPLLLGRALTVRPNPHAGANDGWAGTFLPVVLAVVGGLAALIVALAWWFRRGDRRVRRELAARRDVNPFAE